jgi:hypothetical protein
MHPSMRRLLTLFEWAIRPYRVYLFSIFFLLVAVIVWSALR